VLLARPRAEEPAGLTISGELKETFGHRRWGPGSDDRLEAFRPGAPGNERRTAAELTASRLQRSARNRRNARAERTQARGNRSTSDARRRGQARSPRRLPWASPRRLGCPTSGHRPPARRLQAGTCGCAPLSMAEEGLGLAYAFEPMVMEQLRTGRLQRVLESHAPTVPGFSSTSPAGLSAPRRCVPSWT
jgi:hypothetical protein